VSHVSFGLTVDFFQPNPPSQLFGGHSATSGAPGSPDGFFNTGTMTDNADNYFTFDGRSYGGGNLNAGTYNYYCIPHGAGMEGQLIVDPDGTSTSVSQTAGSNPSIFGQTVTFTATVSNSVFFSFVTPTGTVRFADNGLFISGSLPLNGSGQATFTSSTFLGGSHSITAFYTPSNGNFTLSDSTGSPLSHTVNAANTSTALALTSGTNPATAGQSLSFTATVTNTSGTGVVPVGNAIFEDNGTPLGGGTIALDGAGHAVFTTSALAGGTHPITAVFSASNTNNFNGSSSAVINEAVHDFSLSISNPVQSVLPNQTATFNGTLSAFGGYSSTITVSCQGSPPATCTGASVPLAANAQNVPFTVTASNPAVANFSFSISGSGAESLTHAVPVTLSVGSFSFSQPTPNSVSVAQGNPSSTMTFQISSLGAFTGEVDLSCPTPPSGVTCMFSNGASTQALVLSAGQVINDTLVLNTTSSVPVNTYPITVQATPVAAPGQFQTRSVTLTETAPARANTFLYLGNSPNGTTENLTKLPVLLGVGNNFSFDISAFNSESSSDSHNVNITLIFAKPVATALASVTRGTGGESCMPISAIAISCSLGTITAAAPWIKTVTYNVTAASGRTLDFTAILSESNVNLTSPTVLPETVKLRYRPMLRPGLMPGNNNPK